MTHELRTHHACIGHNLSNRHAVVAALLPVALPDFQIELRNSQELMAYLHPSIVSSTSSSRSSSDDSSTSSRGTSSSSSRSSRRGADCVTVPKPYVSLCTSKILTMEWIDGVKVNSHHTQAAAACVMHH